MNVPTELWHLIIESYGIKTYKSCILVNKMLNKVTNKIIANIPDKIIVKCHIAMNSLYDTRYTNRFPNSKYTIVNSENLDELWVPIKMRNRADHEEYEKKGLPDFIIRKNCLLMKTHLKIYEGIDIPLPTESILKNKSSVIHMKYLKIGWIHYYDKN